MAVIAFPTGVRQPVEFSLGVLNTMYASGSGETLTGQIVETLGAPWLCRMSWSHFSPSEAQAMQAFIDAMQGFKNVVRLWNFWRPVPKGTVSGVPLVKGAGQTGTSLLIDGMTPGMTFEPGDMIGRANLLYRVVTAAAVDGFGEATLDIRPPILVGTSDNEPITLTEPKAYFRLRSNYTDVAADGRIGRHWARGLTLEFIEVLP